MNEIIRYIKHRRDTDANWTANNPILLEGQFGLVTDAANDGVRVKIGDGVTAWNSLSFYNPASSSKTLAQTLALGNTSGANNLVMDDNRYFVLGSFGNGYLFYDPINQRVAFGSNSGGQTITLTDMGAINLSAVTGSIYSDGIGNQVGLDWNQSANQIQAFNLNGYWAINTADLQLWHDTQITLNAPVYHFTQLSASTVPYLNASSNLVSSSVTPSELGYLSGVSSAIQTQLNGKQPLATNLTSLSGLTYVSASFVKMTASGTFTLDTNTYLTGNQTITLSGDVSGSGATSITTSISNTTVTGKLLTGYTSGAGTITATDSILQAIQKLNGNIAALVTGVSSVFGRTGVVTAQSGDYNTSQVTENTNLYFTDARAIAAPLTGYTSGAGTISATDTILQAIQKLNGNIGGLVTGVSSVNSLTGAVALTGTANRLTISAANVFDISSTFEGLFIKKDGTVAFTGDQSVGDYKLTSVKELDISGTAGNGFINLVAQSSNAAAPSATGLNLFASSNGNLRWAKKNGTDTYVRGIVGTFTADRDWTLQDTSDTFVGLATTDTLTNKTLTTPIISSSTSNTAGAIGYDGLCHYGTRNTNNQGVIPVVHFIRQNATYTLTNTASVQQIFNGSTNGRITLPVGTYRFFCLFTLTSMSGTSGNLQFSIAGTATTGTFLYHTVGVDSGTSFSGQTMSGSFGNASASPSPIVGASTGQNIGLSIQGSFEVTVAGTIIPSLALANAAAAIVAEGSFFECWAIGSTSVGYVGAWD